MAKFLKIVFVFAFIVLCGFKFSESSAEKEQDFDISELYDYQKEFKSTEIGVCASNSTKTYMDYRATTATLSRQYQFIHNEMTVDTKTGFLYDKDGFIGAALGSYYGQIGDRYYFTLDSGVVLPIVKCEEKSDNDTDYSGCYHLSDGSVIEFVIDRNYATNYFGTLTNSLVLQGNYNNYHLFKGQIIKVEKVSDERNENYVTYHKYTNNNINNYNIFNYAAGY